MTKYKISVSDSRFDDMGFGDEDKRKLILEMISSGALDLSDFHIESIEVNIEK